MPRQGGIQRLISRRTGRRACGPPLAGGRGPQDAQERATGGRGRSGGSGPRQQRCGGLGGIRGNASPPGCESSSAWASASAKSSECPARAFAPAKSPAPSRRSSSGAAARPPARAALPGRRTARALDGRDVRPGPMDQPPAPLLPRARGRWHARRSPLGLAPVTRQWPGTGGRNTDIFSATSLRSSSVQGRNGDIGIGVRRRGGRSRRTRRPSPGSSARRP